MVAAQDTCCRADEIALKIAAVAKVDEHFSFYNANAATTQFSVLKGGQGFSGINANFYPQLVVWLCRNPKHALATAVQDFLSVGENVVATKYPTAAKGFLGLFAGFPITRKCRNRECCPLYRIFGGIQFTPGSRRDI
jgi:4-hydroxy-tetrahydrodipicolinate synthase